MNQKEPIVKKPIIRCLNIIQTLSLFLVKITERYLTHRQKKRIAQEKKMKKRGVLLDWGLSFFWAAGVVLLLNQYLIQGYQIPSGSMIPTLIQKDRIFVNKIIYGPELLPGFGKIPALQSPKRFDVVIFESPDYVSKGTFFEVIQRILYMLTLSLVDINKQDDGSPRVQFLIKRLIGMPGDYIKLGKEELLYKVRGTMDWMHGDIFRSTTAATYPDNDPSVNTKEVRNIAKTYAMNAHIYKSAFPPRYSQLYDMERALALYEHALSPSPLISDAGYSRYKNGWFVGEQRYFFMGDNRDNSLDARRFSSVSIKNILGKAYIIYWPFTRFSLIK